MRIFTVGHSNLEFEDFAEMIEAAGVASIVDVRKLPGSRKYPWFNGDHLAEHLPTCGITYSRSEGLTGMGVDVNVKILDNLAAHVAPALGGSRTTKDQSSAIHRLILAGRRTFA